MIYLQSAISTKTFSGYVANMVLQLHRWDAHKHSGSWCSFSAEWLTLTGNENPSGVKLFLEPSSHSTVPPYRAALIVDGIPANLLRVIDVHQEFERLQSHGVEGTQPPTDLVDSISVIFNDTCSSLVQIIQFDG